MASSVRVSALYRQILKAARDFPSKKRTAIIEDIKTTFHEDKNLTDKSMIQEKRKLAMDSLEQLQAYTKVDSASQDWQVSLKGSCL